MHPAFSGLDQVFGQQFDSPELLELLYFRTDNEVPEVPYHDVQTAFVGCELLPYTSPAEEVPLALSPFDILPPLAYEAMQSGESTTGSNNSNSLSLESSLELSPALAEPCVRPRRGRVRLRSPPSPSDCSLSPSHSRSRSPSRSSPDSSASEADAEAEGESRKGPWAADEDRLLRRLVGRHGASGWAKLAHCIRGRTGKQCRDRWMNHICPSINRGPWTPAEDELLLRHQALWGNAWCRIAKLLPNRPYTAIKNRWYGSLRFQADKARRR